MPRLIKIYFMCVYVFIFVCIFVCIKMLRLKRLKIELNSTYSVTEKADIC